MTASPPTLRGFVRELARVSPTVASGMFRKSELLFKERPELLEHVVRGLPWANALAVLRAAYFVAEVPVAAYGAAQWAVLRSFADAGTAGATGRGGRASWAHASRVLAAAVEAHGNRVPAALFANTARVYANRRSWVPALQLVRAAEHLGVASRLLLLHAARAAATPASWDASMRLLVASGALGARDPRGLTSTRRALAAAVGAAPWAEAVRLLTRRATREALGSGTVLALVAQAAPLPTAVRLHERIRRRDKLGGAGGAAATAGGLLLLDATHPERVLEALRADAALRSACRARQWARALHLLQQVMSPDGAALLPLAGPTTPTAAAAGRNVSRDAPSISSVTPRATLRVLLCCAAARRYRETLEVARCLQRATSSPSAPTASGGWPGLPRAGLEAVLLAAVATRAGWADAAGLLAGLAGGPDARSLTAPSSGFLTDRTLSLLVRLCAQDHAPAAALRYLAIARREKDVELKHAQRLQAVLFCQRYGRWREALALYAHAPRDAQPLLRPFVDMCLE